VKELRSDNTAELYFVHGPIEAFPPEGFEEFFGGGPYFRFIRPLKPEEGGGNDLLDRIRNFPKGATAEDQMRELMRGGVGSVPVPDADDCGNQSAQEALDYLYRIMEEQGPFDGIIGYSEGATIAATILLHEQRRFEIEGIPPMFKCALFFAGWPPMNPELNSIVLADESDLTINIPTCHISKCRHNRSLFITGPFAKPLHSWVIRSILGRVSGALQHLRHGQRLPLRSRERPYSAKR
jgi:hypothetical protein